MDDECITCGEGLATNECPNSERPCGHHCNCSWTQDCCHWCGEEMGGLVTPLDKLTELISPRCAYAGVADVREVLAAIHAALPEGHYLGREGVVRTTHEADLWDDDVLIPTYSITPVEADQ